MPELKRFVARTNHRLLHGPLSLAPQEPQQRRMMVVALTLLLVALGFVLYHDRDFWFPATQEAEDQAQPQQVPASAGSQTVTAQPPSSHHRRSRHTKSRPAATAASAPPAHASLASASPSPTSDPGSPVTATTTRTVLPPLEVEVVAGDSHRVIQPGNNAVRVNLQPDEPDEPTSDAPVDTTATAASVTTNAAEHVQISGGTAEIASRPVRPDYPPLARQMKVQGSVILQALIGRDGLIQDLHVLSGPPILASAALEAVKQWHFKPHYLGAEPVETQAKITVNFTISTN